MTVTEDGLEYRLQRGTSAEPAVVVFPGAHMNASCSFGEDRYLPDRTVLVVSRPGYGGTSLSPDPDPAVFAARVADRCRTLGLSDITAIGISMGARSAAYAAADHPDLISRLILVCPVSFAPWPDLATRRLARVMFNPVSERLTWAMLHSGLRHRPDVFLRLGVRSLSSLPPEVAVARLGADADVMRTFLLQCRSGRGFMVDLRPVGADPTPRIEQPTLVLSSRHDGSLSADHPRGLAETIRNAEWIDVEAPSHLLWLGDRAETFSRAVADFGTR